MFLRSRNYFLLNRIYLSTKKNIRMAEIEDSHLVICAERKSMPVDVEEGKQYYWCSCGRSAKQPFCDGSHRGTPYTPIQYTATETKKVYFCGCKQSANKPTCDGSHKKLPEDAQGKGFALDYCAGK